MGLRMRSQILGTGAYVPKQVLTNGDLEKIVETLKAGAKVLNDEA